VPRQIKQAVNIGHRHSFRPVSDFRDVIACANFSFLQHAKIKPWSSMFDDQRWHAGFIHPNAQSIAGYPWLRNLEYGVADAVAITNADLVVSKSFNREIFSELAELEITAPEEMLPVAVRLPLVDKHGALLSTMTGEISLRIAFDIQLAHHPSPCHSLAVPRDFTRKADIQREQPGHLK
jgi:hypothetical protein